MATIDEQIESAVVTLIQTAIPSVPVKGRKKPGLREGDVYPQILVACSYDGEDVGHNDDAYRRNVFYTLYIFLMTRSVNADTGDETINQCRQTIAKLLFGPTIAAVPEVDDIIPTGIPEAAFPPQPDGVDIRGLGYDVETYEPLT